MDNYSIIESLGLDIREISKFEPIIEGNTIYICLTLKRRLHRCPYCGSVQIYLKEWKCRFVKSSLLTSIAYLEVKYPRYFCRDCKKTFSQQLSISYSTNKSKRFVEKVLHECLKIRTYADIADQFDTNAMEIIRKNKIIDFDRTAFDEFIQVAKMEMVKEEIRELKAKIANSMDANEEIELASKLLNLKKGCVGNEK